MEPLSALSIATAVVQFLDFTGSILSATWTIYKSEHHHGLSEHHADIQNITNSFLKLTAELRDTSNYPKLTRFSSQDDQIAQLSDRCREIGERLVAALDRLKAQKKRDLWESFRLALRTVWSEDDINTLQQTLESYRQQIMLHVLASLREQVADTQETQRQADAQTRLDLDQIQRLCQETLRQISSTNAWQSDAIEAIKRSSDMHRNVSSAGGSHINQNLLECLRFSEMEYRYEEIAPAYKKTFEWLFQPSLTATVRWADFAQWLRSDDPLYWVTGKPGSGKSTLMRFIYDDRRTKECLRVWAADRPLLTPFFFFWNSGSAIQMSFEGLLRTLLYQILRELPYLIPDVFPHRLQAGLLFGVHAMKQLPWTLAELLKAFRVLAHRATETHKLVFFIDGMDEFEGRSSDLVDFALDLVAPGIKICASSRPWNVFEDAFNQRPHLRMEDLTFNDIELYVRTVLTNNRGFQVLQPLYSEFCSKLITDVCIRSSGVFLWVILVVQSLLEGLTEGERVSELESRLAAIPNDLENLFRRILGSLSPSRYKRASQLFQLVSAAIEPITLLEMSYADEDNPAFALQAPCALPTEKELHARMELMRRRINACCKGLLETKSASAYLGDRYSLLRVGYLHRTVRDFLQRNDIWSEISAATDGEFNPNLRLCNAYLMRLKNQDPEKLTNEFFWHAVTHTIEYAVRSDPTGVAYQIPLIEELGLAADKLNNARPRYGSNSTAGVADNTGSVPHWTWTRSECCQAGSLVAFAVQCQLIPYVEFELKAKRLD